MLVLVLPFPREQPKNPSFCPSECSTSTTTVVVYVCVRCPGCGRLYLGPWYFEWVFGFGRRRSRRLHLAAGKFPCGAMCICCIPTLPCPCSLFLRVNKCESTNCCFRFLFSCQITDQVSLEGHGIIARPTATPAQEAAGGMWLPVAPTAPPVAYPTARNSTSDAASQAGAARLVAQQAMDEARLGLGDVTEGKQAPLSGRRQRAKPLQKEESESCSSWCSICAEDAVYRCAQCEDENSVDDDPELFCARCFKDVHRDDPEMKAHQPQALSKRGGQGTKGGKKGLRNWKLK